MSMEEDISNIGAKLTQIGATLTQLTSDQFVGNIDLETIRVRTPGQGQATMANSSPVVIASNQSALPVSGGLTDAELRATPVPVSGTVTVQGDVANDAPDSGNPVKIGGVARITLPTAVSDGDRVNGMYSKIGKKVVCIGSVRELVEQGTVTLTTTAETTLIAAGAAGVFHDLTNIFVANTSGTARRIDFRDATAGAVIFSINVGANVTNTTALPVQIVQTTAANNWTVQMDANATDVRIFAGAVKNL